MVKKDKVRLGDVCTIVSGTTPKTVTKEYWDGELNWITPAELSDDIDIIYKTERKITNKAVTDSPLKLLPVGTVLLSSRAPIGKVAIVGSPMYCNQGFKNLICSNSIFNKFLYWFLKGKKDFLNSLGRGATFKEISKSIVADIQIPLPPLSEQKRIAAILDKATELIALRKQQIEKLDLLVKSRFIEMFGNTQTNPKELSLMPWCDVFLTTTGKLDSNAMVKNGQYPFFTCAKECFRIDTYAFDCEALLLAGNNAAGIYDVKYYKGKFNAYQRTYVLILINKQWSYKLFKIQLEDKLLYLQNQSKGSNTRYLTLGILNKLQFIVPPISEQNTFDAFVTQVDKSKSILQQSLEKLELNYKALMQTYFG